MLLPRQAAMSCSLMEAPCFVRGTGQLVWSCLVGARALLGMGLLTSCSSSPMLEVRES